MATTDTWDPEALKAASFRYFELCDSKDLELMMAEYADDARETVFPEGITFAGHDAIRRMYVNLFAEFAQIRHEIREIVVDAKQGRVATQQSFAGERLGGAAVEMYNCNFFEFDSAGRVSRVQIWMSGENPLHDN